ncbi:ATP-binding protein [Niveibacterium sp. 24ML]|uniref:sensor histidine kinase n=1 Tax=Niveibacterium sp. 24ML TaxID=2985512 RepID=UPI00227041CE|nr:ATP-binding protein [Niveibacterium sp. 24ML]MCX9155436.1 ATP-binding protein [Niveibacterium sp. 24ML]
MASERHARDACRATRWLRVRVVFATLVLVASAVLASHQLGAPRVLVLCALAALAALGLGGRALARLRFEWTRPQESPPIGDAAAMQQQLLAFESWLEYAPVALWQREGDTLNPINAAARRLMAPGRAASDPALEKALRKATGASRSLLSFESERGVERAVMARSELVIAGRAQQLLALMPIESELEAEMLEAWRQLVHVLTHEIMNSLTPIASLSRTAQEMLAESGSDALRELDTALEAIARRAAHLVDFVSSYRSLSRLPPPSLAPVRVAVLLTRVEQLVAPEWRARGGVVRFATANDSVELMADAGQLEQALLNLIRNAADATAQLPSPVLEVSARLLRGGRLAIEVMDNGPGVEAGLEGAIFTPFFTTKPKGLGVGLALVRCIVHGMGGTVRYTRRPGEGACFRLTF